MDTTKIKKIVERQRESDKCITTVQQAFRVLHNVNFRSYLDSTVIEIGIEFMNDRTVFLNGVQPDAVCPIGKTVNQIHPYAKVQEPKQRIIG